MPSVRSVSLGFWIGTGSRYEPDAQAGLSHLLEHLLFKGTDRYASVEIDQIFDGMGAELNAGTGKETTSVYARVIDEHLTDALDVMADMVFRPALSDIESEREVILEEIAMYEDDPQEKVFDLLGEATFGADPLGRAIIGRAQVISDTPADAIAAFHGARYRPEQRRRLRGRGGRPRRVRGAGRGADRTPSAGARTRPARSWTGRRRRRRGPLRTSSARTPSSTTCASAAAGCRATTTGASRCGCWTRSSAAPRPRGCSRRCASSGDWPTRCTRSPAPTTTPARSGCTSAPEATTFEQALSVVGSELARLRESPVSPEELHRAKENLKGRVVLALESTGARMSRLGSEVLAGAPLIPIDELVAHIDAVTVDDLGELARELWDPERLVAAGIGPDRGRFDAGLDAVGPALAAGRA